MTYPQSSWRHLIASIIVAVGLAVLWGSLYGWGASLVGRFNRQSRVFENIRVAADGTPVIVTTSNSSQFDINRRTLDGKPWPSDYEKWLNGGHFSKPSRKPGLIEHKVPWSGRYSGGSDGKKPPTAWYLLRNDAPEGLVHFIGIDVASKLPIGYIGRKGFRATPLPLDEHFVLPEAQAHSGWLGRDSMASTQYFSNYQVVQSYQHQLNSELHISPWLAFVTDQDRLVEVDLRKRSVRTVLELPGLKLVSTLSEVVPNESETEDAEKTSPSIDAVLEPAVRSTTESPFRLASNVTGSVVFHAGSFDVVLTAPTGAAVANKIKTETRLAVLTDDRIVIYDPPRNHQREFMLPEEQDFVSKGFSVTLVAPDQLLVKYGDGNWEKGQVEHLLWLSLDGTIERRERAEVVGWVSPSDREQAWKGLPVIPVPIAWLGIVGAMDPLMRVQTLRADSYSAGLRDSLEVNWPPFVVVLVLALIVAGVALHWHRKHHRSKAGVWWLMVFLFGPVGLLAYWLQQRHPFVEQCASCGKQVPRDREQCASCDSEFPRPAQLGTEIFA